MLREFLVEKRVAGIDQLSQRTVFFEQMLEEHFRFLLHGLAEFTRERRDHRRAGAAITGGLPSLRERSDILRTTLSLGNRRDAPKRRP